MPTINVKVDTTTLNINGSNAVAFAPTADVAMGNHKLINLATPSLDTDAANLASVNNAIAGSLSQLATQATYYASGFGLNGNPSCIFYATVTLAPSDLINQNGTTFLVQLYVTSAVDDDFSYIYDITGIQNGTAGEWQILLPSTSATPLPNPDGLWIQTEININTNIMSFRARRMNWDGSHLESDNVSYRIITYTQGSTIQGGQFENQSGDPVPTVLYNNNVLNCYFANLVDTAILSPTNGQVPVWDGSLNVWKNQTISSSLTAGAATNIAGNAINVQTTGPLFVNGLPNALDLAINPPLSVVDGSLYIDTNGPVVIDDTDSLNLALGAGINLDIGNNLQANVDNNLVDFNGSNQITLNLPNLQTALTGTTPTFSAQLSAPYVGIPDSYNGILGCDQVLWDTTSAYTSGTGIYNPQIAGYYQVNLLVQVSSGTNLNDLFCYIAFNGDALPQQGSEITGTAQTLGSSMLSTIIPFNGTTDYMQPAANANGTFGGGLTFSLVQFSATLISPFASVNSVSPNFSGFNGTLVTVPDNSPFVLQIDSINWDTGSNYDTGTYTYTATTPGYYQVNLTTGVQGTGVITEWVTAIYQNGGLQFNGSTSVSTTGNNAVSTGSGVLKLNTGDTVNVQALMVGSGTIYLSTSIFSISFISNA